MQQSQPTRSGRRPGKICVAIQAGAPGEMMERAAAALKEASFLEFRLDSLARNQQVLPRLKRFMNEHRSVTAIATCRRTPNGGSFSGTVAEELQILVKAARSGCQIVDVEVESAEELSPQAFERFRTAIRNAGADLLVSFHDFSHAGDVRQAAQRVAAFAPDYVKVVSTAQTLADNLAVIELIEDLAVSTRVVGIAMGEEGIVSRVLGPRAGAAFTFASLEGGVETAPGQVSAAAMRTLYRAHKLDSETLIMGVAGNPIAHSLSPLMQNTAFRIQDVNAVLLPLKVRALPDLLTLMLDLPMSGVAITMPLKQEILPHLWQADPLVRRIGACNTLRVTMDRKLYGYNTDVDGVVRPLRQRMKLKGARIVVLGAGGAARAAVFGLVDQGAEVFVTNRTHENAVALAKSAGARALKHEYLSKQSFDVVINSTPCGMKGASQPLPIEERELNAELVFDMVYNPLETPLLKMAKKRGIPVISGLEMFVQQGVRQFEIWTGKKAPEEEMRRVVERELKRRAKLDG